jgi:hypothetical protein
MPNSFLRFLETVLKPLTRQKMSDFEWQTKGNFQGIAAPIALKFATVCAAKRWRFMAVKGF